MKLFTVGKYVAIWLLVIGTANAQRLEGGIPDLLAQLSQLRGEFRQSEKSFGTNSSGVNAGLSETGKNGL